MFLRENNLKIVEGYIMEKITISQAMLKVSELDRIYREKMYTMMKLENVVQEYILEADGSRYDCNEVVDFNREFELIIELGEEIAQIKTKISKSNNENYIDTKNGKISLQGALNRIKYLRDQVNNFENILEGVKSSKERKVDAAATSVYYRVKEPNFNKKELKKYLEDRNEEILELEIALNKANNEILIDID